ncbi:MAG: LacI family DNA-binding transcriptional regulator [Phycisphaeraceae bacterium]
MSISEVAKLAGVSHATVSRVINDRPGVSQDLTRRVREAMKRLNYTPPAKRRGPKPKSRSGVKTGNIALLFVGTDPTLVVSPVTASVLHAAEEALAERGFNMIVGQLTDGDRLPPNVASGKVDGLLMHGYPPPPKIAEILTRHPTVWMLSQRSRRGYWGDRVAPDNKAIGRFAAEYLIDRAHRHIATMQCNTTHIGFEVRARAFVEWAREAGVSSATVVTHPDSDKMTQQQQDSQEHIDMLVDRLLELSPRPTGLFVPRDPLAIKVYRSLRERGVEPGRDITIMSCDNNNILAGLNPRPATIDVRPDVIGARAVDQLIWRMENPFLPVRSICLVEPRLILPEEVGKQK